MNILHTADWHLGHRLHEQSQFEEQKAFLDWLTQTIVTEQIHVLLVSGDIFDTGVPSTQSLKLYYDFLMTIRSTSCKHVVITGGNHDSPGTLNAPKALLDALSIKVVGKAPEQIEDEVFSFTVGQEHVMVAAVPYLRDQDIRKAISGESLEGIESRYQQALINHYRKVGEVCVAQNVHNAPMIAMGHLFAIGGAPSDSEQKIYIGNLGDIRAADFPEEFNYIALGHLHKPQSLGSLKHIRYSGSPNILSFSEVGYKKQVIKLEIQKNKISSIEPIYLPVFRQVVREKGCFEEIKNSLLNFESTSALTPWVEIAFQETFVSKEQVDALEKIGEEKGFKILKTTLSIDKPRKGLEQLIQESKAIKELSPVDVFELKCKEQGVNIDENESLKDAFFEILQKVKKG